MHHSALLCCSLSNEALGHHRPVALTLHAKEECFSAWEGPERRAMVLEEKANT